MTLKYISISLILPIVIWGAAIGVAALLGVGGHALFKDPKKNKLGVLGMRGAGKTRFLSHLRNIPFVERNTGRELYKPFIYKSGNKSISIDAGLDIGGDNFFVHEYNKIITNSDVILYFFDIFKYLDNNSLAEGVNYRRVCNSRFEHVYSAGKGMKISVVFVGTHIDRCQKVEAKVKSEFLSLVEGKPYFPVLKRVEFIDLTNTKQLRDFIQEKF